MESEGGEEGKKKGTGERGEEQDGNERRSNRKKTTVVPFTPGTGEAKKKGKKAGAKTKGTKEKTSKARGTSCINLEQVLPQARATL